VELSTIYQNARQRLFHPRAYHAELLPLYSKMWGKAGICTRGLKKDFLSIGDLVSQPAPATLIFTCEWPLSRVSATIANSLIIGVGAPAPRGPDIIRRRLCARDVDPQCAGRGGREVFWGIADRHLSVVV